MRLSAQLRARGVRVTDPTIVARTGWTTDELSHGIDDARPSGVYDVVTLLIGVNDQYRGRPADEYGPHFRELLARAIRFGGPRVRCRHLHSGLGCHTVRRESGSPPHHKRDRSIQRDQQVGGGARRRRYVDVTPASRLAGGDGRLVASDGLHPSVAMYEDWLRLIAPIVESILSTGHG